MWRILVSVPPVLLWAAVAVISITMISADMAEPDGMFKGLGTLVGSVGIWMAVVGLLPWVFYLWRGWVVALVLGVLTSYAPCLMWVIARIRAAVFG